MQRLFSEGDFAPTALLAGAEAYGSVGDLTSAERLYRRVLSVYNASPQALSARLRLAQVLFAGGNVDGARDLLAELATRAPEANETRDGLLLAGRISLFAGDLDTASHSFDQLRASHGSSAHADSGAIELARHLLQVGSYAKAAAAFAEARRFVSDVSLRQVAHLGEADAVRLSGDYTGAVAAYVELLGEESSQEVFAHARLGLATARGWDNEPAAAVTGFLELIQESEAGTPGVDSAVRLSSLRELGSLHRRRGNFQQAISWFHRYLAESKDFGAGAAEVGRDDVVRLHLADAYNEAGFSGRAIEEYTNLLATSSALTAESQLGLATAY